MSKEGWCIELGQDECALPLVETFWVVETFS